MSQSQFTSAVDSTGNLKLKNKANSGASTSGPSTTSSTFAVIPEMTQTITTKGNKVLITFTGAFAIAGISGLATAEIAIFLDGAQLSGIPY